MLEVLGQLCAVASLGGDITLFGGVATTQRVCLNFFSYFKRTLERDDEFLLYPTKKTCELN